MSIPHESLVRTFGHTHLQKCTHTHTRNQLKWNLHAPSAVASPNRKYLIEFSWHRVQSLQRMWQIVRVWKVEKWCIQHAINHFDVSFILYFLQAKEENKTIDDTIKNHNSLSTDWQMHLCTCAILHLSFVHLLAFPTDVWSMECTEWDRGQPIARWRVHLSLQRNHDALQPPNNSHELILPCPKCRTPYAAFDCRSIDFCSLCTAEGNEII